MGVWRKSSQYSIDLIDGWDVIDDGDFTEIVPAASDAAIHISVYAKSKPCSPKPGDTEAFISNFVQQNQLSLIGELSVDHVNEDVRCIGFYSGKNNPSEPNFWVVMGLVGNHKGVLCTLCFDDKKSKSYSEGLAILKSLCLLNPVN